MGGSRWFVVDLGWFWGSLGILACLDDVFWCKDLLKTFKTTLQIGIRRPQRPAGLDLVEIILIEKVLRRREKKYTSQTTVFRLKNVNK